MKKRKKYMVILLFLLLLFIFLEGLVVFHQNSYTPHKSDAAIILGYSLKDGKEPSQILEQRLQQGLSLYKTGCFNYFIVSGGQGPQDTLPVAEAMKNWLLDHNVAEDRILTEIQSKNTYENMEYSLKIAKKHQLESMIIITSDFHMYRSMEMADDFFNQISGSASHTSFTLETLLLYLKEPFSLLKYYLFLK